MAQDQPQLLTLSTAAKEVPAAGPTQAEFAQKISMEIAALKDKGLLHECRAGKRWEFYSRAADPSTFKPPTIDFQGKEATYYFFCHDQNNPGTGTTYWACWGGD